MVEYEPDQMDVVRFSSKRAVPMEEDDDSIDLVAVFRTLRRERWFIFRVTLVILAIATVVAFILPKRYTSTVSFIPPALTSGSSLAGLVAGQLSTLGASDLLGNGKTSGDLYAGILASRSVASELVARFDLMHEYKVTKESLAEKDLASYTNVTVDPKSTIVTLTVSDESPERARDIANAYMDSLRETNGDWHSTNPRNAVCFSVSSSKRRRTIWRMPKSS